MRAVKGFLADVTGTGFSRSVVETVRHSRGSATFVGMKATCTVHLNRAIQHPADLDHTSANVSESGAAEPSPQVPARSSVPCACTYCLSVSADEGIGCGVCGGNIDGCGGARDGARGLGLPRVGIECDRGGTGGRASDGVGEGEWGMEVMYDASYETCRCAR